MCISRAANYRHSEESVGGSEGFRNLEFNLLVRAVRGVLVRARSALQLEGSKRYCVNVSQITRDDSLRLKNNDCPLKSPLVF